MAKKSLSFSAFQLAVHFPFNVHLFTPGSRIGVVYVPNPVDSSKAEMHFIINGEDQGPSTKDIPYKEGPLHAVVDVYGTTKQVKIIQLYGSK